MVDSFDAWLDDLKGTDISAADASPWNQVALPRLPCCNVPASIMKLPQSTRCPTPIRTSARGNLVYIVYPATNDNRPLWSPLQCIADLPRWEDPAKIPFVSVKRGKASINHSLNWRDNNPIEQSVLVKGNVNPL